MNPTTHSVAERLQVFGLGVRASRAARGWTAQELAQRLGVSPVTIRKIESGAPGTAYGTILALSSLLNLSPDPQVIAASPAQIRHLRESLPRRVNRPALDPALDV